MTEKKVASTAPSPIVNGDAPPQLADTDRITALEIECADLTARLGRLANVVASLMAQAAQPQLQQHILAELMGGK